jgi:hypothetical protein
MMMDRLSHPSWILLIVSHLHLLEVEPQSSIDATTINPTMRAGRFLYSNQKVPTQKRQISTNIRISKVLRSIFERIESTCFPSCRSSMATSSSSLEQLAPASVAIRTRARTPNSRTRVCQEAKREGKLNLSVIISHFTRRDSQHFRRPGTSINACPSLFL